MDSNYKYINILIQANSTSFQCNSLVTSDGVSLVRRKLVTAVHLWRATTWMEGPLGCLPEARGYVWSPSSLEPQTEVGQLSNPIAALEKSECGAAAAAERMRKQS